MLLCQAIQIIHMQDNKHVCVAWCMLLVYMHRPCDRWALLKMMPPVLYFMVRDLQAIW